MPKVGPKFFDAFGTEAIPTTLTASVVFGAARTESPDHKQSVLHVHYTPANSGEKITIQVQALEPGGKPAVAASFGNMVTGVVAAGVETLSIHTFEFTSIAAGENRFIVPIPIAFRGIRVGAKDSVGTTGTAWIQVDFLE